MSGDNHNQADPLDLDAIEARLASPGANYYTLGTEDVPDLIAEVRRLRAQGADVAANLAADLMLAEAEIRQLRQVCPCGHLRGNHGRYGDHRAVTGCEGPACDERTDAISLCDGCGNMRAMVAGSPDARSQFCPECMAEVSS